MNGERPLETEGPIWRQRDFLMLWSAATVSVLGSQITIMAVPFIALTMLHTTVLGVSLLAAVEMVPFLIFTLPAGVWLDRVRRRPVLIAADVLRGLVLLSIPFAYLTDTLSLAQLFVVGFVNGTLTAFFDVAELSYLPAIIDREDLVKANAGLQVSYSVAQMGGPTLGGNLIAMATAPLAIGLDAISFFLSGGFVSAIRRRESKPGRPVDAAGRPPRILDEIGQGLAWVWNNPLLRPVAICTAVSNLFAAALFGVFPVLIWNQLQIPPAFYGTVMGVASIGFLAGALASDKLTEAFGVGRTIVLGAALAPPAFLLMVLTPTSLDVAAITLGCGWFVAAFSQVVYNVSQVSLRQAITPLQMQSRMNATMRFIVWGTIPLGFVAGGIAATVLPLRAALVCAAFGCSASLLPVLFSPLRSLHDIPPSLDEASLDEPPAVEWLLGNAAAGAAADAAADAAASAHPASPGGNPSPGLFASDSASGKPAQRTSSNRRQVVEAEAKR